MGSMSIMHWAIVVGVVALLFGKGKISGLMTDAAQGIKAFKKGMAEEQPNTAKEPRKQLTENAVVSTSE